MATSALIVLEGLENGFLYLSQLSCSIAGHSFSDKSSKNSSEWRMLTYKTQLLFL